MRKIQYIVLFLLSMGCKEKYESPVESPKTGYLVIEGTVNNGPGTTNFRLTHTTSLSDRTIVFEKNAQVKIEGENNVSYSLTERTTGNYAADNLRLNSNLKYRLRIKTSGGKEYLSDFVEVKKNPPIDSISWKRENGGLQLYINTHDDQNKTRYYQWEYSETWEFHSQLRSSLKYVIQQVPGPNNPIMSVDYRFPITRTYDTSIVKCWQSNSSTSLQLGSTVRLEKDIVYLPLVAIPPKSWKLGVLYSIFVKQYTWTKEGYEFLEKMKKNTEITGSIFDAQPSELKGNIHNLSDPAEPVVGFFNICNIEEKRIFISAQQIPDWGYFMNCPEIVIPNISDSIKVLGSDKLPTNVYEVDLFDRIKLFGAAPPDCVDCTLRGTNKKPTFWP